MFWNDLNFFYAIIARNKRVSWRRRTETWSWAWVSSFWDLRTRRTKTTRPKQLSESMKPSRAFLSRKREKWWSRHLISLLRSRAYSSATQTREQCVKIPRKPSDSRKTRKNVCKVQSVLWPQKRRKRIWWLEIWSTWFKPWVLSKRLTKAYEKPKSNTTRKHLAS